MRFYFKHHLGVMYRFQIVDIDKCEKKYVSKIRIEITSTIVRGRFYFIFWFFREKISKWQIELHC